MVHEQWYLNPRERDEGLNGPHRHNSLFKYPTRGWNIMDRICSYWNHFLPLLCPFSTQTTFLVHNDLASLSKIRLSCGWKQPAKSCLQVATIGRKNALGKTSPCTNFSSLVLFTWILAAAVYFLAVAAYLTLSRFLKPISFTALKLACDCTTLLLVSKYLLLVWLP